MFKQPQSIKAAKISGKAAEPGGSGQTHRRGRIRVKAALFAALLLCGCFTGCNTLKQLPISEVGGSVGGGYHNPQTGETWNANVTDYMKFRDPDASPGIDPKKVIPPSLR